MTTGSFVRKVFSATHPFASPVLCQRCHIHQQVLAMASANRVLTLDNLNSNVVKMEYAVRGPLVIRALAIEKELSEGAKKSFSSVIRANIGDAHAMGQKPISFIRQVLACVSDPSLINDANYPSDVKQRAKLLLSGCGGHSVGSYSHSNGIEIIRKHVAEYITRRDGGIPSYPQQILLSGGASEAIRNVLKLFIDHDNTKRKTGVMIPIPQYPLYSATVVEFALGLVGYYLDESNNWSLNISELERAYKESLKEYDTRVLCVINPGNPTGQVLTKENVEQIIKFAYKNKLFLLADEVYQDNIYGEGLKFYSFKSVMKSMGKPFSELELCSFHSCSKGYMGECGLRGGYAELINIDPDVFVHLEKMTSAKLCSTVLGQCAMDCVVKPPALGEPSYDRWLKEKTTTLNSLKSRADAVCKAYDSIDGITCNSVQGAMYAFPRIHIPQKAVDKAKSMNQEADFFYAMQLLESSGICVVPGSGFGQKPGTYHFRTTILPQEDMMSDMLERFRKFHNKFMLEYS
uniref:alanine transaminase n=1 Tax=Setaria digitata TaxID=48799 RepID=A0A915PKV4_9BILA